MFDQILSIFKGFLARSFWFGSFLPVAIFALLNIGIAAFAVTPPPTGWPKDTAQAAAWVPAALGVMILAAYTLAPLVPLFRGWLDGSLMPEPLHDALRRANARRIRKARDEIAVAMRDYNVWNNLELQLTQQLWGPRQTGVALKTATSKAVVDDAEGAVQAMRVKVDAQTLPLEQEVRKTADLLVKALTLNSSDLPQGHSDYVLSARLESTQLMFVRVLGDGLAEAKHRFTYTSNRSSTMVLADPQATRVGDAKLLAEKYSSVVYAIEFEFLWPRIPLVFPDKDPLLDKITDARAQIDFSILSFVLVLGVPVIWLPYLAMNAYSPYLFLAIGIATPFFARFFYELTVQSQVAFGEVVKTTVDRFRLDVLTKILLQPMPATRLAERELWRRVREAEDLSPRTDLNYRRPS